MTEDVASRERERLAVAFPTLKLDTSEAPATVTGTLWLESGFGFSVDLRIPDDYPEGIPQLPGAIARGRWHRREFQRHPFRTGLPVRRHDRPVPDRAGVSRLSEGVRPVSVRQREEDAASVTGGSFGL